MILQRSRPELQLLELRKSAILGPDLGDILDKSEMLLNTPGSLAIRFIEVIGPARFELRENHFIKRFGIKFSFDPLPPNMCRDRRDAADDEKNSSRKSISAAASCDIRIQRSQIS